jgi:hypothetical protein
VSGASRGIRENKSPDLLAQITPFGKGGKESEKIVERSEQRDLYKKIKKNIKGLKNYTDKHIQMGK